MYKSRAFMSDDAIREGILKKCKRPKGPLATPDQALTAWLCFLRYTEIMRKADQQYFQAAIGTGPQSRHSVRSRAYEDVVLEWQDALDVYLRKAAP